MMLNITSNQEEEYHRQSITQVTEN